MRYGTLSHPLPTLALYPCQPHGGTNQAGLLSLACANQQQLTSGRYVPNRCAIANGNVAHGNQTPRYFDVLFIPALAQVPSPSESFSATEDPDQDLTPASQPDNSDVTSPGNRSAKLRPAAGTRA